MTASSSRSWPSAWCWRSRATCAAAEPERKSGNQILVCEPGKPCELRGKVLSGPTACSLGMADYAIKVPSATRITCVKVEGK
jgi:hypothetical protein